MSFSKNIRNWIEIRVLFYIHHNKNKPLHKNIEKFNIFKRISTNSLTYILQANITTIAWVGSRENFSIMSLVLYLTSSWQNWTTFLLSIRLQQSKLLYYPTPVSIRSIPLTWQYCSEQKMLALHSLNSNKTMENSRKKGIFPIMYQPNTESQHKSFNWQ